MTEQSTIDAVTARLTGQVVPGMKFRTLRGNLRVTVESLDGLRWRWWETAPVPPYGNDDVYWTTDYIVENLVHG